MNKLILISLFLLPFSLLSQECNCLNNFEWVKKTFEENDAGFEHIMAIKGETAYSLHNKAILEKIKASKTLDECRPVLFEWLKFFRSGHIAIRPIEEENAISTVSNQFADWETYIVDIEKFKRYLNSKTTQNFEGIWKSGAYTIGVKKDSDSYVGFIIDSKNNTWTQDQVKFKISEGKGVLNSIYYMGDHSAVQSNTIQLLGKNYLQIGDIQLVREYPVIEEQSVYSEYFSMIQAKTPYIKQLNDHTIYFRIPSFHHNHKKLIDSVIVANKDQILSTENLIIDIRNGTGGSDHSYSEILPLIYTNPIRIVGLEFLSTSINNQRMIEFATNPEKYALDEETAKFVKKSIDKLEKEPGKFVNLNDDIVSITEYDTIYKYPKRVGIIINKNNGSTDEQFLLAAKQSKKVKLFGTTTHGVLDISNMYFITSPCNEFELGYALSRSMRIPDLTIDEKGIQPDYFFDKSISIYEWTNQVNKILNEK